MSFLVPDSQAAMIADIDRRLRALESAQRVGLNRVRMSWNTSSATVGTFGAWYTGPAGCAYIDDLGNTGTGYPRVTLVTGEKALVLVQGYAVNIANDPTFRTYAWYIGFGVDSATPPSSLADRYQTHGPTTEGNNYQTMVQPIVDLTPGEHTFYLTTKWEDANPAAVNLPTLSAVNNAVLVVIPID